MESKGRLTQINKNWKNGNFQLTFELDSDVTNEVENLQEKDLRITVKRWREKRSLDANAYYWALLGKVAEALSISKSRAHNLMLRKYGQAEEIDGCAVYVPIPDTDRAEETALEAETFHIKPTSQVIEGTDGVIYRTYRLLKGSHEYDTKEMSVLIDGLISEAKEMGIETLTPRELEEMYLKYGREKHEHE